MLIPRTNIKTSTGAYYYNITKREEDYRKIVLTLRAKAFSSEHDGYISRYYQQKVANVICHICGYSYYSMEEHYTFFYTRDESKKLVLQLAITPELSYEILKGSATLCQNAAEQS